MVSNGLIFLSVSLKSFYWGWAFTSFAAIKICFRYWWTWTESYRVGNIIRHTVWLDKSFLMDNSFRIGVRKAKVFPVPDFDWAIMLWPEYLSKFRIVWYWMGVGLMKPHLNRHCTKKEFKLVCSKLDIPSTLISLLI